MSPRTARLETFCCEALERVGELPTGRFAVAEPVEQPDPHRLTEGAKAAGDQFDEIAG